MSYWWQQQPVKRYHTVAEGVTLANGQPDIEKGDIYAAPAGTPISIPIPSVVEWEDHEHVVLKTNQGILNFLHVNPDVPVGTQVPSNSPFASSSFAGSNGNSGTYVDNNSHMIYRETGGIIEFGWYDTIKHAADRETLINGVDQPNNFDGISDPLPITTGWQAGKTPQSPVPNTTTRMSSFPMWGILLLIGVVLFLVWRKRK